MCITESSFHSVLKNISFTITNNGKEAIETLKTETFNVILMDLQMPIMDGYEATAIIKGGSLGSVIAGIPIIAITADAIDETRAHVLKLGMCDYITKPLNQDLFGGNVKSKNRFSIYVNFAL